MYINAEKIETPIENVRKYIVRDIGKKRKISVIMWLIWGYVFHVFIIMFHPLNLFENLDDEKFLVLSF